MSKINVNVIDPSVAVPNTGGEISGFSGDNASLSIIPIILAVIILGVLVFAYFRKSGMRLHKQSGHFSIRHTKTKITSFFILSLVIVGSIVVLAQKEKSTEFVGAADNTLSITVGDASMDVVKSESGAFATVGSDITVNSSTDGGYVLTVFAESSDLTLESDVEDDDNSNVISGLSTSDNTTLAANTWGIAISQSTEPTNADPVWQKVPSTVDSALTIKETDIATPANDKTTVYYGVNIDGQLSSGSYSNTLVYAAVAKPTLTCGANKICYSDNGANSVSKMGSQNGAVSATNVTLWASNYQYPNHGFAGWNTKADGTGVKYGPNETITLPDDMSEGLKLYAMWIRSAGSLQNWNGCGSLAQGATTALTDERDGDTYAVAKLADGKCWMIENLRLADKDSSNNDIDLTSDNTHNPSISLINSWWYSSANDGDTKPASKHLSATTDPTNTAWCKTDLSSCYDQSMLATNNTTLSTNNTTSNYNPYGNVYSYGNYYNWYSATGGHGKYDNGSDYTAPGDICPAGWHLPTGKNTAGDFGVLDIALGGTGTSSGPSATPTGATMSLAYRTYPNNFVYSGTVDGSWINNRYSDGFYWSASGFSDNAAYYMDFDRTYVYPGTNTFTNYGGRTVRCVAGV